MADDFRTRTRNFLGLDPLKGAPPAAKRSAYARFTAPGPDTTRNQLLGGALLYVFLTVFCIALVLGSVGVFGRVVFAVIGLLGFIFAMQRIVLLVNGGDDAPRAVSGTSDDQTDTSTSRPPRSASRRTGGATGSKKAGGARRSGNPRRSH